MTARWAIALPQAEAPLLGPLRGRREIEVCQQGDTVWLRGPVGEEALELALRALPAARFELLSDKQLVPHGATVPYGYSPDGPWFTLAQWMSLALPLAALAGRVTARVKARLVRGGTVREANVLLTTAELWQRYAETASQVRLAGLSFAMSADEDLTNRDFASPEARLQSRPPQKWNTLVRGTPLPPIFGERFVEETGIAIPVGYTWSPPLQNAVFRAAAHLEEGDLALVHADDTLDRIRKNDFTRASRSAARLSAQGANHG